MAAAAPGGPLARLGRALTESPDDRAFRPFLVVFAAYLAIRGIGYEVYRPLIPLAALLLVPRTRRAAALLALGVEAAALREHLLRMSNHGFLETLILALLAAFPTARGPAARTAYLRTLLGVMIAFTLWTGLQKLLHGYYTSGSYFLVEVAVPGSKFGERLAWLLGGPEREALAAYQRSLLEFARTAAGGAVFEPPVPRLGALPALTAAFCAVTLAAELCLPPLLVPRRTRRWAAVGLAAFIAGVEVLADEWHFALLFAALLLPFLPRAAPPAPEKTLPGERAIGRLPLLSGAAAVALVALWPAAQHVLTRTHDLDPWKLGGFAMYAAPKRWSLGPRLEVRTAPDGPWQAFAPGPGAREAARREAQVLDWAPFASGAALRVAGLVRAARPDATGVRVRTRTVVFDRTIDRFRLRERIYEPP